MSSQSMNLEYLTQHCFARQSKTTQHVERMIQHFKLFFNKSTFYISLLVEIIIADCKVTIAKVQV